MHNVYVIAWSQRGPSKIGVAQSIPARLDQLQIANPYRLRVFFAITAPYKETALKIEQAVLHDFRSIRLVGEWMALPPKTVAAAIKKTCDDFKIAWTQWSPDPRTKRARERQLRGARLSRTERPDLKPDREKQAVDELKWLISN